MSRVDAIVVDYSTMPDVEITNVADCNVRVDVQEELAPITHEVIEALARPDRIITPARCDYCGGYGEGKVQRVGSVKMCSTCNSPRGRAQRRKGKR